MYGHFSHDDNKDISVHLEKDQPLNKRHQNNWQKCKSKKKKQKTYTIKLLGINVEDFEDRERFLKSINAKANQVKNLRNNQHHKQTENPSDQLGKNTCKI